MLDYCHIGITRTAVTVEKRTSEVFTQCFCSQINLSEYRSRVRKPVDQRKDSNLSEYRSRVRKPVDQRKDSISSDQSSSPQPSTSTFLPPSFTPSHLTAASYSLLTPGATPPGTSLTGGVASSVPPPQFEPVSPDETDPSPMHITSDGTCTCIYMQYDSYSLFARSYVMLCKGVPLTTVEVVLCYSSSSRS